VTEAKGTSASQVLRVFIAGEGRNELGRRSGSPAYQGERSDPGVIEALLRKVRPTGWEVSAAVDWKELRKFKARTGGRGDGANVAKAHLRAREHGCDVIAFVRDRDGVRFEPRESDIEAAIAELASAGAGPRVIGGVAIEKLESWLVALAGVSRSEALRRPEEHLAKQGIDGKDTAAMVAHVDEHGIHAVPEDAASLRRWLDRARAVLGADDVTSPPAP